MGCWRRLVPLLVAVAVVAGCVSLGRPPPSSTGPVSPDELDDSITVSSFNFAESELLGEIYAQALEGGGFPVDRVLALAAREIVQPALQQGLVDVVPEYLGSALESLGGGPNEVSTDPTAIQASLDLAFSLLGVDVLDHAPAQNQNGVAVTTATARRYGLSAISDLAEVAPELAFGGPPECPRRPLCLAGLEDTYGLRFERFVPLDTSGRLTIAALDSGEVDVGLIFTTDGDLAGGDLMLLRDDRGLQPAENVVPVVRSAIVDRYGAGVTERLDAVSARLTTEELVQLNGQLDRGEEPAAVAVDWLRRHGLSER